MATQYRIERDAENEHITVRRADDTTAADVASYPKIKISLADLFGVSGIGATSAVMKARQLNFKAADGTSKTCAALMTDPTILTAVPTFDNDIAWADLMDDGRIAVVGSFSYVSGIRRMGFAVLNSDLSLNTLSADTTLAASTIGPSKITNAPNSGASYLMLPQYVADLCGPYPSPSHMAVIEYSSTVQGYAGALSGSTLTVSEVFDLIPQHASGSFYAYGCGRILSSGTYYGIWRINAPTGGGFAAVSPISDWAGGAGTPAKLLLSGHGSAVNRIYAYGGSQYTAGGADQNIVRVSGTGIDGFTPFSNALITALVEDGSGNLIANCAGTGGSGRLGFCMMDNSGAYSALTGVGLKQGGSGHAPLALAIDGSGNILFSCDTDLLFSGANTYNGTTIHNLARCDSSGVLDGSFTSPTLGGSTIINRIIVEAGGTILIFGSFSSVNGTTRSNVARLSSTGVLL